MPGAIIVNLSPTVPHEEKHDNGNIFTLQPGSQHNINKRQYEEPHNESIESEKLQRRLWTKTPVNYRYLDDPLSNEEETYQTTNTAQTFQAIKAQLTQLKTLGTWKLVDCPSDAVPIPNKWVFLKKYNNESKVTKYKTRLVTHNALDLTILKPSLLLFISKQSVSFYPLYPEKI